MKIVLVPIGPVAPDLLQWCKEHLPGIFDSEVVIAKQMELPNGAYDPSRKQFLGDAVLDELHSADIQADRVAGLLDQDCYASGLNFIFGQASPGRKEAFVALPRLRQTFYGLKDNPELFRQRVLKEIIHELGHTWGLPHCSNPKCIMHFSNSLKDTDIKGPGFCEICLKRISTQQLDRRSY
jgi:archaemetzincin